MSNHLFNLLQTLKTRLESDEAQQIELQERFDQVSSSKLPEDVKLAEDIKD